MRTSNPTLNDKAFANEHALPGVAFGLMVTLIWLYMEFLRLLAKTRRR